MHLGKIVFVPQEFQCAEPLSLVHDGITKTGETTLDREVRAGFRHAEPAPDRRVVLASAPQLKRGTPSIRGPSLPPGCGVSPRCEMSIRTRSGLHSRLACRGVDGVVLLRHGGNLLTGCGCGVFRGTGHVIKP